MHTRVSAEQISEWLHSFFSVGVILNEEFIRIPKSLFDELMQARDKDKPISSNLQNLIQQQTYIKHKKER